MSKSENDNDNRNRILKRNSGEEERRISKDKMLNGLST